MMWANMKHRAPYSTSEQLTPVAYAFAEHFCISAALRTHSAETDQVRVNIWYLQYMSLDCSITTRLLGYRVML